MANQHKASRSRSQKEMTEDELLLEALGRLEEEFPMANTDEAVLPEKASREVSKPEKSTAKHKVEKKTEKKKSNPKTSGLPEKTAVTPVRGAPTAAEAVAGLRSIDPKKSREDVAATKPTPPAVSIDSYLQ